MGAAMGVGIPVMMGMAVGMRRGMPMSVRMIMCMIVGIIVVVMAGCMAFLPIVSLHPKAPSRDAAALSPDKPALRESDRKGGKGFLENLLGHPEVA
jgi:hypothetical protein